MRLEFSERIVEKNTQISNFMKICPVGAESLHPDGHANGQTDRRDKANNLFSQFCKHA
jgi:hypothetical protein